MNTTNNVLKICSLCGFKFLWDDAQCCNCPMNKDCRVICCPHCGYQMVDETHVRNSISEIRRKMKWLKKTTLKMRFWS